MEQMLNSINYRKFKMNWLLRIFIYLIVFFIFQVVFLLPFGFFGSVLSTNPTFLGKLVPHFIMIASPIITVILFEKSNIFRRFGFLKKGMIKEYLFGYILGTVLITLCAIPIVLFFSDDFSVSKPLLLNYIFSGFIYFFIQGAGEEVMVRGMIFPVIAKESRPITALLVTSLFFGILHLANPGVTFLSFINLVLAGLMFGYCVIYFDSLWQACALHSAWNFIQGNVFGFLVSGTNSGDSLFNTTVTSGTDFFSGGQFGIEGSFFCFLVLGATVVVFHLLCVKKGIDIFGKSVNEHLESN